MRKTYWIRKCYAYKQAIDSVKTSSLKEAHRLALQASNESDVTISYLLTNDIYGEIFVDTYRHGIAASLFHTQF